MVPVGFYLAARSRASCGSSLGPWLCGIPLIARRDLDESVFESLCVLGYEPLMPYRREGKIVQIKDGGRL